LDSGRADSVRAFRAAARHSRRVRFLRKAIPIGVLAAVAIMAATAWFSPFRMLANLPIDFGNVAISGTKIKMEAPRLSGFTRDARPYELTAKTAAQDLTKPDRVELEGVNAKLRMLDESSVQLTATNGLYDTKSERLTLKDNIVLTTSNGYRSYLSEALVDMRNGSVISDKPVEVTMPRGKLTANRLEVADAGEVVRFHGGVTMTLRLHDQPAAASTAEVKPR
jgi:lipopolysaccharide export system protein LptC